MILQAHHQFSYRGAHAVRARHSRVRKMMTSYSENGYIHEFGFRPLFIIIFRPEMLKFHPYSILTGDTRFEFVIYCVLSKSLPELDGKVNVEHHQSHPEQRLLE